MIEWSSCIRDPTYRTTLIQDLALTSVSKTPRENDLVLVEVVEHCGGYRALEILSGQDIALRVGMRFVGVMVDDDANAARQAVRSWDIPYDVALDTGGVAQAYKVELLPTVVLIDDKGVVRRVWTGAPSRSQLETWLTEL